MEEGELPIELKQQNENRKTGDSYKNKTALQICSSFIKEMEKLKTREELNEFYESKYLDISECLKKQSLVFSQEIEEAEDVAIDIYT